MTRAEAIKILERRTTIPGDGYTFEQINEALDLALSALRGPAREMVERMFPGCKMCQPVCHKCKNYPLALYPRACKTCVEHSNFEPISNFCEACGKPLTDEAVDMMAERMREIWTSE